MPISWVWRPIFSLRWCLFLVVEFYDIPGLLAFIFKQFVVIIGPIKRVILTAPEKIQFQAPLTQIGILGF